MRKRIKKSDGVVKGAPSGFVISIMIHAAAFLLAGMLVVFTVHQKEEKKFVPPKPVDRPKMKLKKPKVKVKKTAKPKSSTRIVTKVKRASMPDIQLPEMSGIGEGFSGGIGGFEIMPDLSAVSMFGSEQSIGNDLEGTMYDLKRDRRGKPLSVQLGSEGFKSVVEKFIQGGWRTSTLSRFYRSPRKLYSPTLMVPPTKSHFGPWAFGEREMAAYEYLLHYTGQLVHKEGGRFRFVGMGDNMLVVRVNGKVVLDFGNQFSNAWDGQESKRMPYHLGHWWAYAGQWMDLEPGVGLDLEIIIGEYAGGLFGAMLAIEEEGVDYPRSFEPGPMLPIFKTAELSRDQVESIYEYLWEDHLSVTNGPVFSDYGGRASSAPVTIAKKSDEVPTSTKSLASDRMRLWTLKNGKSMEGEYVLQIADKTVLKNAKGKQIKVPTGEFSEEDMAYLELANPPELKLSYKKEGKPVEFQDIPNASDVPVVNEFASGVVIEQTNKKPYGRTLKVELFSIASEHDGNNFILLARQEDSFTLSAENGKRHEVWSNKAYLRQYYDHAETLRGEKLKGHMIVVTDEREEIIAQRVTNEWMLDIIDKLRVFPVGRHFNESGERVYPPRPKRTDQYWEMDV